MAPLPRTVHATLIPGTLDAPRFTETDPGGSRYNLTYSDGTAAEATVGLDRINHLSASGDRIEWHHVPSIASRTEPVRGPDEPAWAWAIRRRRVTEGR